MDRTRLAAAALALLLPAAARADIVYSYNATPNTPFVTTDGNLAAGVKLSNEPAGGGADSTDIVLTNLKTASESAAKDTFTARPWSVTLRLTDGASGLWADLTFTGLFDGTLSKTSAKIKNTFTGPTVQSVLLGGHLYTVGVTTYVAPGPPSSTNVGSIGATIDVDGVRNLPEPGALTLAGLALAGAVLAGRRRRRAAV